MRFRVDLLFLAAALACFIAPWRSPSLATSNSPQRPDGLYAEIQTGRGLIVARLEFEKTPLAVTSFVGLAEGTLDNEALPPGEPYYDGSVFHRVVPGHVIQAGMPAPDRSQARGPGYTFPNEIHADLSHDHAGALGMANGGPHTNSAQFYITLGDRSYLDGDYIVFGDVVEGMDVVRAIEKDDVIESIRIERVGAEAEAFLADATGFERMATEAEARVESARIDRARREAEWVGLNLHPDRVRIGPSSRLRRFPQRLGRPGRLSAGDRLSIRYAGMALRYRGHMIGVTGPLFEEVRFASSADGTPQNVDLNGVVFEYEVGVASVTPGFDEAISGMRRGGQEIVVVPAWLTYGTGGFYGPDLPDRERLVISPDTMVVYAIEVLEQ